MGVTLNWNVVQAPVPVNESLVEPGLPVPEPPPVIVTITLLPVDVALTPAPTKSILVTVFVNVVPSFLISTFAAPPPPPLDVKATLVTPPLFETLTVTEEVFIKLTLPDVNTEPPFAVTVNAGPCGPDGPFGTKASTH